MPRCPICEAKNKKREDIIICNRCGFSYPPEKAKDYRPKEEEGECHYHLCRKETRVRLCPYCNEYFCNQHLRPKPPGMPRFKSGSTASRLFMDEYHREDGHPCPIYHDKWVKKIEAQDEAYGKQLDKIMEISRRKEKEKTRVSRGGPIPPPERRRVKARVRESAPSQESSSVVKLFLNLVIIVFLVVAVHITWNLYKQGLMDDAYTFGFFSALVLYWLIVSRSGGT